MKSQSLAGRIHMQQDAVKADKSGASHRTSLKAPAMSTAAEWAMMKFIDYALYLNGTELGIEEKVQPQLFNAHNDLKPQEQTSRT